MGKKGRPPVRPILSVTPRPFAPAADHPHPPHFQAMPNLPDFISEAANRGHGTERAPSKVQRLLNTHAMYVRCRQVTASEFAAVDKVQQLITRRTWCSQHEAKDLKLGVSDDIALTGTGRESAPPRVEHSTRPDPGPGVTCLFRASGHRRIHHGVVRR